MHSLKPWCDPHLTCTQLIIVSRDQIGIARSDRYREIGSGSRDGVGVAILDWGWGRDLGLGLGSRSWIKVAISDIFREP